MSVNIREGLISKEQVDKIKDAYRDRLVESSDRAGFFESFGDQIHPSMLLAIALSKNEIEQEYDIILDDYNLGVVKLVEGAFNGLHSDMYNLDGSDHSDGSERKDELEFSAILYLSTHGVDFTGGELVFPQHDLKINPESGTLVFFRGDLDHTHKVRHILSGERYAIVMFFGK